MEFWHTLYLEITALLGLLLILFTIPWVLLAKKNSTSAVAWCLLVFFLPIIGSLFFLVFGYQHVHRPLKRKQRHKKIFRLTNPPARRETIAGQPAGDEPDTSWQGLARLAQRFGAFPVTRGNHMIFYYEGTAAFEAKYEAIRAAQHHIHLEYFIFQPDDTGRHFVELLTQKARAGAEVRLLYDAMGSRRLHRPFLQPLLDAGGKCCMFLPLNLLRRRIQVNMRDHRKLLIIDGKVAFTGGLNIGDEYLGKVTRFGHWRDTHMRIEGPAVAALQRVFTEDWDFSFGESLQGDPYFPPWPRRTGLTQTPEPAPERPQGERGEVPCSAPMMCPVQVIESGPDEDLKGIREIYFAAIQRARKRLWIASPYFVPDAGLLDALCMAGYSGIDVRLLCQYHPDKWIPFFAGRYYWGDVLNAGVKVYQYKRGMMHAKVVLVDSEWASVGTANLDNRSLHLNFEVNCLIYSPQALAELEESFLCDLHNSIRLDRRVFAQRPMAGRLLENTCRLLSPVL